MQTESSMSSLILTYTALFSVASPALQQEAHPFCSGIKKKGFELNYILGADCQQCPNH